MIQFTGTINTESNKYVDESINVYFLSYSHTHGILAICQICLNDEPQEEILKINFSDSNKQLCRRDIELQILTELKNNYPDCNFILNDN